jgi:drug/metabolite transporter (DMT)-like permease
MDAREEAQDTNHMSTACVPTRTRAFRLKTAFFILIIIIFAPLGNVLLSKGMKPVSLPTDWNATGLVHLLGQILSSPYVWLGISSLLVFFAAHMLVLNWADYSYVQPASSVSYLSLVVFSYLLLGERVSALRMLGIGIICAGVIIVGRTHPRTTEAR